MMHHLLKHRGTETPGSLKLLVSVALLSLLSASCSDDYDSEVPDYVVNFTCSLQQSPYSLITTPGQYLTVTKDGSGFVVNVPGQPAYRDGRQGVYLGFGGLIIGCSPMPMSSNNLYEYVAYDLACPVEAADLNKCLLSINTSHEGKCSQCGTLYNLDNGFPKEGVGKERLKTYKVSEVQTSTGTNLTIRN